MTYVKFNQPGKDQRSFLTPFYGDLLTNLFDTHPKSEISTAGIPPVNISETASSYLIELAAPGNKREDFLLNLEDGKLSISVEKKEAAKDEGEEIKYTRREIIHTAFSRSFTLPEEADQDAINASYDQGILTITINKREDVKLRKLARKIDIK